MSQRYFDAEFAAVEYDEEINIVIVQMTEYADGEQFREYMHSIIEAIRDTGCPNVLVDSRHHPPLAESDMEWSAETWGPKAEIAGAEQIAALVPEHVAAKRALDNVTEQSTEDDIERRSFAEFYDAVEWLRAESA